MGTIVYLQIGLAHFFYSTATEGHTRVLHASSVMLWSAQQLQSMTVSLVSAKQVYGCERHTILAQDVNSLKMFKQSIVLNLRLA